MANEFTKGPWTVNSQGRDLIHINAPKPDHYAGLMSVAVLDTQALRSGDELIGEEQMRANAYLIAAAPELLEALEMALIHIQGGSETEGDRQGLEEIVISAIKKARG